MFSNVSQFFNTGNIAVFNVCFQGTNYAPTTRWRISTKIQACEQLQKFSEHEQASSFLIFQ